MTSETDGDEQFRTWLRRELRSRRMSVRQVAQRSGLSPSTISRVLASERRPSLRTAVQIMQALDGGSMHTTSLYRVGALRSGPDAAGGVERALRADGELSEDEIRRVMSLYLSIRRGDWAARRPG